MGITDLNTKLLFVFKSVNKTFSMKKIIFISLFLVLMSGAFLSLAQAQDLSPEQGLNATADSITAFKEQTKPGYFDNFLQTKVGQIIGTVLTFVGALFFILMIYAGIMWMTSQGNDQQVTKAKDLLINAIIGIIIVFAAYAITSFLGTELLK